MHLLENKRLPFTPQPPKIPTHKKTSTCRAHREEQTKVLYHTPKKISHHAHTQEQAVSLKKECIQRAKKVVSDFAIGLVNSVFNLPDRQVMFYEEFE